MSWPIKQLGEVAQSIRNGIFARRPSDDPSGTRILRISAVRDGRVNIGDSKFVAGVEPDQLAKFAIESGDLLVTRYNGSRALVGTAGIVPNQIETVLHPDKLIRVVINPEIADSRFVNYQLQAPHVRAHLEPRIRTTAGQSGIAGADLRSVPLALPPLEEQLRIVKLLEDHLSRLDAAGNYVCAAERRLDVLVTSILLDLIPDVDAYPARWERSCIGAAGTVELGRQRHPGWHSGSNMKPYLRVANVFEDRIDTRDVMEMHWPSETFERFKLRVGDVLLNEGQTPDLLGRPALYRGEPPEVAFTNSLLRFIASDRVIPEFALLVFRRHMRAGRFKRESRITTNIAHLSASRLKPIEFPIPDLAEQAAIVESAHHSFEAVARQCAELVRAKARAEQLRRALLATAFSGRLTISSRQLLEEFESV